MTATEESRERREDFRDPVVLPESRLYSMISDACRRGAMLEREGRMDGEAAYAEAEHHAREIIRQFMEHDLIRRSARVGEAEPTDGPLAAAVEDVEFACRTRADEVLEETGDYESAEAWDRRAKVCREATRRIRHLTTPDSEGET